VNLLLECARARPDLDAIRRAAAVIGNCPVTAPADVSPGTVSHHLTDWDTTVDRASAHGLAPLLYWYLKPDCPDALRTRFHSSARQSLFVSAELLKTGSLFEDAKIPFMPFKGPVLAWSLYETPALREMSDLDVLIRPADISRAAGLLQSHGYRRYFSCTDTRFFRYNPEFPLQREGTIDLHWGLLPAHLGLDPEGFWQRARPMEIAGREFSTFCPDDLLLFLCVHGSKHEWKSLAWLADVARLIDRHPIAWDAVFIRARQAHLTRPLVVGLTLVRDLLGAPVPNLPADPRATTLVAAVRKQLLEGIPVSKLGFRLALTEGFLGKLRCWLGVLSPDAVDYETLRIPASLYPVYYLTRPFRLLAKYGAPVLRRLLIPSRDRKGAGPLFLLLWLLTLALVITGELLPGYSAPMRWIGATHVSHNLLHFAAYGLLAFIPVFGFKARPGLLAALSLIPLGVVLELAQRLVPARGFEVADMVANTLGVLAGTLSALQWNRPVTNP
jgi:hypothetical protein